VIYDVQTLESAKRLISILIITLMGDHP